MPRPLSPDTLVYDLAVVGDPRVSPDGSRIVYTLTTADRGTRTTSTQLWRCGIDGADARQISRAGTRNACPRWSPDGSQLAFVSDRVPRSGIFVVATKDGALRELMRMDTQIQDLAWSPDGARVAFVATVDPAGGGGSDVRVTRRIDYKQDTRGFVGDVRLQLFVVDVTSGQVEQLTHEPFDHAFPAWSPDGRRIAVQVMTTTAEAFRLDLVSLDGAPMRRVGWEFGKVGTYAWSPDGGRIVLSGEPERTWQPDYFVCDLATDALARVTDDPGVLPQGGMPTLEAPSQPVWLDDTRVLLHAYRAGASGLYVLDTRSGALEPEQSTQRLAFGMSIDAERRFVAQAAASPGGPAEVFVLDREAGTTTRVTHHNDAVLAEAPPARWERFEVDRGRFAIEAWLLKPPDFDESRSYPVVLDVHGGPNYFYGYNFEPIQQCLATNGFLVVYANPRGSGSYGREFTQAVIRDWGGEDYGDLMTVLDAVLERPYADGERTGIWGHSYGGYMTAWTIGHTDRFKAAVAVAPCFNLVSMYGTSDIGAFFGDLHWGGPPHEHAEWYTARSPSTYAHQTRTPTLILHGEADDDVPIGQGEELFVTLKRAGCEVEFVRYPGEPHLFLQIGAPEHRRDVMERMLGWFRRWLVCGSGERASSRSYDGGQQARYGEVRS